MKHRQEIEIKLEVRNPRVLKRRVAELGFHPVKARHFESNYMFDFPDLRLRKARCLLRLRFVDRHGILTLKGVPLRTSRYKVRPEFEAVIKDGQRLRDILESLGLRETFRYEKYRTVYAARRKSKKTESPVLVYDETPIGNYVELEGSKRWIDKVARQLGYGREDYIPASYGKLYRQKCLGKGEKPGNMVFPSRKS